MLGQVEYDYNARRGWYHPLRADNVVDRHIRGVRAQLQNDWRRPRRFMPVFSTADEYQA